MGTVARASTPSVTTCMVSPIYGDGTPLDISAVILPNITRDMPIRRITIQTGWSHLDDLMLADPTFGEPGRIDAFLGVEVYVNVLRDGRRKGPPGAPMALETDYGWILCGSVNDLQDEIQASTHLMVHHVMTTDPPVDELIKRFWELEEVPNDPVLSQQEKDVVQQFEMTHSRDPNGRFIVTLPRRDQHKSLGESQSQAVRRFQMLERSLHQKQRFCEVNQVIEEYMDLGHAEPVPEQDMKKDRQNVFYMPIHVVYKASSTSTKIRAVFDASAKNSAGVSFNGTLLVGPTIHS